MWNQLKVNKKTKTMLVYVVLTLNRFHTFFWCFHSCLWTSKCRQGTSCYFTKLNHLHFSCQNFNVYTFDLSHSRTIFCVIWELSGILKALKLMENLCMKWVKWIKCVQDQEEPFAKTRVFYLRYTFKPARPTTFIRRPMV